MMNSNSNELAIEIAKILEETVVPKKTEWCIYRVPIDLREVNKDAYTPKVISIGPFHSDNERLQNMRIHKQVYLKQFVERTKTNLDHLVSFIEELEPSVRCCYAEKIMFNKKQLAKIILLDACFVIEFFLKYYQNDWSEDDPLSSGTRLWDVILLDLLLLENQLPFFVLEKLFNWVFPIRDSNNLPSFHELTFKYFESFHEQELNLNGVNVRHFADLLRYFHLQQLSIKQSQRIKPTKVLNFSATKLHEAGMRFEANNKSQCLQGLQFLGRTLKIPEILVDDSTEVVFRNMVAFEQCHCPNESYITDYVTVFDCLINTDKDVDVLVQNRILINCLDDNDAAAKMFNGLGKNVLNVSFSSDYLQLFDKLNGFCTNPCQKLKATLRHDYCKTPWQTAASIAGILLLFLTVIQTILSAIQVMQQ